MTIKQLKIQHLRNITEADVSFSGGINFITGRNGSGKSTLLESVYMLGRGRSFRTTRFGPVVQQGEKSLSLFAVSSTDRIYRIGMQKSATQTRIKVNGNSVQRLSDIARITPLQILTPLTHEILERGPEYRRRFLEWGVFHVEPAYFDLYKKYLKALRQRNSLLKCEPRSATGWNQTLGKLGDSLNQYREHYFNELLTAFQRELHALDINAQVELSWRRGWEEGCSLSDVLCEKEQVDIKQGYTHAGPHRADLRIVFDQRSAFTSISRGQQKMVTSALHLAQASITYARTGIAPLILFDDLVAELDLENRKRLLDRIHQSGCQAFITSTDALDVSRYPDACQYVIENGVVSQSQPAA